MLITQSTAWFKKKERERKPVLPMLEIAGKAFQNSSQHCRCEWRWKRPQGSLHTQFFQRFAQRCQQLARFPNTTNRLSIPKRTEWPLPSPDRRHHGLHARSREGPVPVGPASAPSVPSWLRVWKDRRTRQPRRAWLPRGPGGPDRLTWPCPSALCDRQIKPRESRSTKDLLRIFLRIPTV